MPVDGAITIMIGEIISWVKKNNYIILQKEKEQNSIIEECPFECGSDCGCDSHCDDCSDCKNDK